MPSDETTTTMTEQEMLAEIGELREQVRLLQQEVLRAQKLSTVGELASSITHEFNNILTTVINYAKMGVRHQDPPTRDKAFDKILAASQRASKITTGMLSYARQQSERRERMDLTTLIQDVLILVEKDLQRYRIRLETRIEGRPEAEVNSGQIQQVLLNLIVNARQAMPNGGTLTVGLKTSSDNSVAEISVKDTGTGIPAEKLQRIFEPFFTTKVADERGQGGTGLGLSLARDVMETHGGRIRVESAVGVGTTFTLKLPLANAKLVQRTTTTAAKPAAAR